MLRNLAVNYIGLQQVLSALGGSSGSEFTGADWDETQRELDSVGEALSQEMKQIAGDRFVSIEAFAEWAAA